MATNTVDAGLPSALLSAMNPKTSSTSSTKSDVEETQDRFMKLLVTQMKNQDPLNPMDNAQVTSQFAQLSTVTGIDKMNDTMATLMGSYQASQTLQAASMIGHGVLAPGSKIDMVKGVGLMGVELSGQADKVSVTIRDSGGTIVRTLELGEQKAGSLPIAWDGKSDTGTALPDGRYTFQVGAKLKDATVSTTALQFGLVGTVSTDAKGIKLNVEGMSDPVTLADVRQIL